MYCKPWYDCVRGSSGGAVCSNQDSSCTPPWLVEDKKKTYADGRLGEENFARYHFLAGLGPL